MNNILKIINRDFGLPDDPTALNEGILETIKRIEHSILDIGLRLLSIKTGRLYRDLGFKNMTSYVLYLSEKTKKNRSCIFNWLLIGETYVKHMKELDKAGFSARDSCTKLPYLERALDRYPSKEVYQNIKMMSQREFADYARSLIMTVSDDNENADESEGVKENKKDDVLEIVDDWGSVFFFRGMEVARVNKNIKKNVFTFVVLSIKMAFEALGKKGFVVAVHLDNNRELERFEKYANQAREDMRNDIKMEKMLRKRKGSVLP